MRESRVFIITGMHRSGTSLTASWLETCGVKLFNKMPAGTGNEKGHFEDQLYYKFQQEVILNRFPKSKGWILPERSEIIFNEFEKTVATNLVSQNLNEESWGWKDPRNVLFLSSWDIIINNPIYIIIWRPFNEVVDSLLRRSKNVKRKNIAKISKKKAIQNWIYYNENIVEFVNRKNNCLLFSIDTIIENSSEIIKELNTDFNTNLQNKPFNDIYSKNFLIRSSQSYTNLFNRKKVEILENKLTELSKSY